MLVFLPCNVFQFISGAYLDPSISWNVPMSTGHKHGEYEYLLGHLYLIVGVAI